MNIFCAEQREFDPKELNSHAHFAPTQMLLRFVCNALPAETVVAYKLVPNSKHETEQSQSITHEQHCQSLLLSFACNCAIFSNLQNCSLNIEHSMPSYAVRINALCGRTKVLMGIVLEELFPIHRFKTVRNSKKEH